MIFTELVTQTIDLNHHDSWAEGANALKARVFGQMQRLSQEVVMHYRSDAYHDVHWLDEHVMVGMPPLNTWFYSVRDTGTSIGTDADLVAIGAQHMYRMHVRFASPTESRLERWLLDITEIAVST